MNFIRYYIIVVLQVFSTALVWFSNGGDYYRGPVEFNYMEDLATEYARNVTIKLHGEVGKFVKIQLFYASRWMLLSEVYFISGKFDDK